MRQFKHIENYTPFPLYIWKIPFFIESFPSVSTTIDAVKQKEAEVTDPEDDDDEVEIIKEVESPIYRRVPTPRRKISLETCPICSKGFPSEEIQAHAATCEG